MKRVVESIGEVGRADEEGQLHDLLLVIILPQLFKDILPDSGCGSCNKLNKMESRLVLIVKGFTASVEEQVLKLLVGHASLLRRSNVGAGSILATVDH